MEAVAIIHDSSLKYERTFSRVTVALTKNEGKYRISPFLENNLGKHECNVKTKNNTMKKFTKIFFVLLIKETPKFK